MLRVLISFRRILARERGAVALEAILSITLMIGVFYVMWGAALIVYNQSKVASAAQFASQGALVVYDRSTYRGGYPAPGDGSDGGAYDKAAAAAQSLVEINGTVGMAPDQFAPGTPTVNITGFDIACSATYPAYNAQLPGGGGVISNPIAPPTGYTTGPCENTPAENANGGLDFGAQVTRVEVDTGASADFWLLSPLTHNSQKSNEGLTAKAAALSAGPYASP
jgi:hypothetical protein